MGSGFKDILDKEYHTREDLIELLTSEGDERRLLFARAAEIKEKYVGRKVYYRGLIEFSNVCSKNCYYCGIRKGNRNLERYNLSDDEIIAAARFSLENNYASIALQSGELESDFFTSRVENLLKRIMEMSDNQLGITISLGEQTDEVYKRWMDAGARRYLLRIEASDPDLYMKLHPDDGNHRFSRRVECLKSLKSLGYQTGTGVMIGLPWQTPSHLASDIEFMRDMDIDMCGMGPYIEHADTPLIAQKDSLMPLIDRFDQSLKMIAVLRIVMKDINIAAATALQAIDPMGREKGVMVGANIVMPNVTPGKYRDSYKLYENKPCTDDSEDDCKGCLEARLGLANADIGYGEWGDSKHYARRKEYGS
ncbi:MAG: [FeFe] hydrogenase H-cluster radical SAM maturase HydE [Bacteroidales bacterium]|nr:[FeFe] hydrogenase H-cluster radical SAM maturase HydE [Bacteroidales bacterium]